MAPVANVHVNPCVVFFNVHLDFIPFISSLMIGVVKIFIEKLKARQRILKTSDKKIMKAKYYHKIFKVPATGTPA